MRPAPPGTGLRRGLCSRGTGVLDAQGIRRDASYGNYPMKTKKGEAHKGTWQVTEIIAYLQVPGGICAQRAVWPVGISAIIGRRENKTAG